MKNKAPLALMELAVMLLIFALAAALCLQVFVWSDRQSEQIALRDEAVLQVQNVAELVKARRGDLDALDGETLGNAAITELEGTPGLRILWENTSVEVKLLEPGTPGLGAAAVTAADPGGGELFGVKVYWQEPLKGGDSHE